MKCIGYYKENLKSYLITYDELDPYSKYHCWVYQRADLNRVLMSQAIGPYCDIKQDVTSWNYTEGAMVALDLVVCLLIEIHNKSKTKSYILKKYIFSRNMKENETNVQCISTTVAIPGCKLKITSKYSTMVTTTPKLTVLVMR